MEIIETRFFEKHIMCTTEYEITDICTDFFREFNTTYFNFVKRYNNGTKACLSSNAQWMKYFYENKLYENIKIEKDTIKMGITNGNSNLQIVFWVGLEGSRVVAEQSKNFNIGNGVSLAFKYPEYIEFFYFGTDTKNTYMTNVYANNINILFKFIHYFKHRAKKLITLASEEKNLIKLVSNVEDEEALSENFGSHRKNDFLDPIKYSIYHDGKDIFITKREMECIKYLMEGMTATEISNELVISERTAERHLENAKNKLNCRTKHELICAIMNGGFRSYN